MFDFKDYFEAKTISEAINYLSENENAIIISGGTDILIKLRERQGKFVGANLVGIKRIPQLKEIFIDKEENIIIGATCSFTDIENNEIVKSKLKSLSKGAGSVGGPQIRNMGTIGGNVCNGAVSADTAAVLFTYNAIMIIENKNGVKEVPIKEFYLGPGKVALEKGDLLCGVKIKKPDYQGFKGDYIKFAQRNAMDIATLGCAVLVKENNNKIEDLRIAFGVAAPTPIRAEIAEEFAKGKEISDAILEEIGQKCLENTNARDSWRGSKQFREQLITKLPKRAINTALKEG